MNASETEGRKAEAAPGNSTLRKPAWHWRAFAPARCWQSAPALFAVEDVGRLRRRREKSGANTWSVATRKSSSRRRCAPISRAGTPDEVAAAGWPCGNCPFHANDGALFCAQSGWGLTEKAFASGSLFWTTWSNLPSSAAFTHPTYTGPADVQ